MKTFLTTAVLSVVLTMPALGDTRPVPIRGEVQSYVPGELKLIGRDGEAVQITTPENLQIVSILPREVGDIQVGDAVSTTAVPNEDGGLTALQISILPAALAGVNEGQNPWDAAPDSVMTNARISGVAAGTGEGQITMNYDDKTVVMDVPEGAPVVAFGPGDATLLQEGADVFIVAMQGEDGTLMADRVIAETDGIKPPM